MSADSAHYFLLDHLSVVDVRGVDATTILHNLTTNEIKSLAVGEGCETFVTDVRGKTLGHFFLYVHNGFLRLIGAAGQSSTLAGHVDKYTIREDASPVVRDDEFNAFVLPCDATATAGIEFGHASDVCHTDCHLAGHDYVAAKTRWLGDGTAVILVPVAEVDSVRDQLESALLSAGDITDFHHRRTLARFPWYGVDIDDTNLPQEINRDSQAISFNKGCYLGQETVARLDALGQVQRKLVTWKIEGGVPGPGTTLQSAGKTVGRLTSIVPDGQGGALALGFARRSHFDPGATAECELDTTGNGISGTVL